MLDFINQNDRPQSQVGAIVQSLQTNLQLSTVTNPRVGELALAAESAVNEADRSMLINTYNEISVAIENIASELGIADHLTAAQKRSAAIAGMLGSNYRRVMSTGFKPAVATENSVVVEATGLGDVVSERSFALEAYDERENKNASIYSIAYNMQSARQDEFGETFFPTITISPDQAGFGIHVNLMMVFDGIERKITGDVEDFKRKNIIRAVADPSVLRKEQTKAVPVYRPQSAHHFVDTTVVPVVTLNHEGVDIETAPLKFGASHDLISLSAHDQLLAGGIMNETDSLDPYVTLAYVYVKVGADILKFNVSNLPLSNFVRGPQNNYRVQNLNFETTSILLNNTSKTFDGAAFTEAALQEITANNLIVRLKTVVTGKVNIETGEIQVFGNHVEVYSVQNSAGEYLSLSAGSGKTVADGFVAAEMLGYEVVAYRANMNRRQRGQLIDTQQYTQMYMVPLRSPITAQHPINTDAQVDASDVQALVTATRIRVSNEAVTSLINASVLLREYVDARDVAGVGPDILGVGRFYIRPTYFEETIDMATAIDSVKSHERSADIQAVLVNKIRDYAFRMYRDSEYKAAADALAGGIAPMPTVIIGTDPVLSRYVTLTGELRTLGGEFDVRVVSSLDRRVAGRIFISFGVFDANRNVAPNPLNFGNMFWAPELVLTANISRGNAISRETVVQPRYLFVTNMPAMTVLTIENVPDVLNKVPLHFRQV